MVLHNIDHFTIQFGIHKNFWQTVVRKKPPRAPWFYLFWDIWLYIFGISGKSVSWVVSKKIPTSMCTLHHLYPINLNHMFNVTSTFPNWNVDNLDTKLHLDDTILLMNSLCTHARNPDPVSTSEPLNLAKNCMVLGNNLDQNRLRWISEVQNMLTNSVPGLN
jgi:hypothetical protein